MPNGPESLAQSRREQQKSERRAIERRNIKLSQQLSLGALARALCTDVENGMFLTKKMPLHQKDKNAQPIPPLAKGLAEEMLEKFHLREHIVLDLGNKEEVLDKMNPSALLTDEEIEARRKVLGYQWKSNPHLEGKKLGLNIKIARVIREADQAQEALAENNSGLIFAYARKLSSEVVSMDDLIGEGNIGLTKAIKKFDWRKEIAFSTYAVYLIRGQVQHAFRDTIFALKPPRSVFESYNRLNNAKEYLDTVGKPHTLRNIVEASREIDPETALTERQVEEIKIYDASARTPDSLNRQLFEDESVELGESDAMPTVGIEDGLDLLFLSSKQFERVVPDRRDRVIIGSYFYGDMTQSEIAQQFGISQMQVSRLLRRTLRSMRAIFEEQTA